MAYNREREASAYAERCRIIDIYEGLPHALMLTAIFKLLLSMFRFMQLSMLNENPSVAHSAWCSTQEQLWEMIDFPEPEEATDAQAD